jgi:hypothetical protein
MSASGRSRRFDFGLTLSTNALLLLRMAPAPARKDDPPVIVVAATKFDNIRVISKSPAGSSAPKGSGYEGHRESRKRQSVESCKPKGVKGCEPKGVEGLGDDIRWSPHPQAKGARYALHRSGA